MSGVNDVLLFDDTFSDTDPILSEEFSISDDKLGQTIFIAATGVDVTIDIEVQDPNGDWHTLDTNTTLADATDAVTLQTNLGRGRVTITPASGSGSAVIWVRAFGG